MHSVILEAPFENLVVAEVQFPVSAFVIVHKLALVLHPELVNLVE